MFKKINLILVGIGLALTLKYNIGFVFLISVLLFYLYKDSKNLLYLIPSISLSSLLFIYNTFFNVIILELIIVLFFILLNSLKITRFRIYIYSVFIALLNIFGFYILKLNYSFLNFLLLIIISILIYLFLCFEDYIYLNNIIKNPTLYVDHIIVIIAVLGFSKYSIYGVSLGIVSSLYFSIYYAKRYPNIYSLILLVFLFLIEYLGFSHTESILILLIASLYFLDFNYLFFLINLILIILLYTTDYFVDIYLYTFMITSIIFEVLWLIFGKKPHIEKMSKDYLNIVMSNCISLEYNTFSSFLEFFIDTFKNTKAYSDQLTKAISCLYERHCNRCNKQSECYNKNKTNIVYKLRSILENKQLDKEFLSFCPSLQSIKETASMLSNQMISPEDSTNAILLAILKESKQVLDKYQLDISEKEMIKGSIIEEFHNKMYESSFNIKQIKYFKLFKYDYLIEVVATKKDVSKNDLLTLIKNSLKLTTNIDIEETGEYFVYTIIPKQKIHIKYGYGSLSSRQNELCGDNHLIKSYQNGHFLAAISDGMGKGYKAFEDSKRVLDALDSLCYCATSVNTNIEILNLLYILQGYTERYSTIDAIDINRSTMNASIYKLGASSSYIFHEDNTYTKIENNSLPLGIEEDVLRKEIELKYNDLILLSSDGIFENIVNENGLLELIKTIKDELPQKIAYEVLQYTINSKVKVKDDMSIVILKVEQIT
jgi:serine/threonine protein phosphatase PrpC